MGLCIKKRNMNPNEDLKYCTILLKKMKGFISSVSLIVYENYPNISQGKIVKEIKDPLSKNLVIKDIVPNQQNIYNYIYEFKFKLKVDDYIYDAFLRLNNYNLKKIYGNIILDIFGNSNVSNLGDLISLGNNKLIKLIHIDNEQQKENLVMKTKMLIINLIIVFSTFIFICKSNNIDAFISRRCIGNGISESEIEVLDDKIMQSINEIISEYNPAIFNNINIKL